MLWANGLKWMTALPTYLPDKTKNGNTVLRGTIVAFTPRLVQVLIDGETTPKNLNAWKVVLIKEQNHAK